MENINELAAALSRAQGKVENAKKLSKNPHFKSTYADLATIWDVIREPLTEEGLSVLQLPEEAPVGQIGLRTVVLHKSGQHVSSLYFMGLKDTTNPQQVGSCLTYMKRYALLGVAGIASEDDDGNAATGRPGASTAKASDQVDYAAAGRDALAQIEASSDVEARALYAQVRNSSMPQPGKDALLMQMAAVIRGRSTATTAGAVSTAGAVK